MDNRFDVELFSVTKRYGATLAVDTISLRVPRGTYCCLLGPSGCGKTTTLRMIAGHEAVTEGVGAGAGPVVLPEAGGTGGSGDFGWVGARYACADSGVGAEGAVACCHLAICRGGPGEIAGTIARMARRAPLRQTLEGSPASG